MTKRQVASRSARDRSCMRRDIGEYAVERISPPSPPKIAESVPGISTIACESGMLTIRRNRIWMTAGARRSRIRGRIPSHVSERRPRIGGADKCAAVCRKAIATVGVGTTEIDYIRLARRRVNHVIVPALTRAVVIFCDVVISAKTAAPAASSVR